MANPWVFFGGDFLFDIYHSEGEFVFFLDGIDKTSETPQKKKNEISSNWRGVFDLGKDLFVSVAFIFCQTFK